MSRLPFLASCTMLSSADVPDLHAMIDAAVPVTFKTFENHCDFQPVSMQLGYTRLKLNNGKIFALKNEPHARFYRSIFKGRKCYYFTHSAIEYIFQAPA
jgi:hypothetical protein